MMKLWGMEPVIPGREYGRIREEMKNSHEIERYRFSDRFLFIPGKGLSWRYLAYEDIRGVISGVTRDSEDSILVSYNVELPNLRVIYRDGFELLQFEREKNAETAAELIRNSKYFGAKEV